MWVIIHSISRCILIMAWGRSWFFSSRMELLAGGALSFEALGRNGGNGIRSSSGIRFSVHWCKEEEGFFSSMVFTCLMYSSASAQLVDWGGGVWLRHLISLTNCLYVLSSALTRRSSDCISSISALRSAMSKPGCQEAIYVEAAVDLVSEAKGFGTTGKKGGALMFMGEDVAGLSRLQRNSAGVLKQRGGGIAGFCAV